ncbi:MAG: hypothetical protein JO151_00365 [Verrucomicrobia bacterium]|nr:hypothetical protein [Verrucomicrobiota bacterium]
MLVVLASRHDRSARYLVERWTAFGAGMITCEDLSVAGWRFCPSSPDASTAVVDGRCVPCKDIAGVLTRLPCIFPGELLHIRREDREYVAAEMGAFLMAWLSSLSCPVLNRPVGTCLSGLNWRPEQWALAASRVNIRVRTTKRRILLGSTAEPGGSEPNSIAVTVIGHQCFGQIDPHLGVQARRLAMAAGVDLLEVRFSGDEADFCFESANLWPDLSRADLADAVLQYLQNDSRRSVRRR